MGNYLQYVIIILVCLIVSLIVIKMKRKDFHIEINKLIQYLGGKDNIIDTEINLSRLKVRLKDTSIVNKEGIQNFLSNIYINKERLIANGEI